MAGPGRLRRWVVRPLFWSLAALALAIAGLLVFLRSDFARERARDLLRARLADSLGREVAIESVDFGLLPVWLEVHGVRIGGDAADAPDFATLRRLRIEADLDGFGRPEIVLTSIEVEGLDLFLEFRAGGEDNIPRLKGTGEGGEIRLRIGGLRVDDSRVRVAERTLPLDLDARAVLARLVGAGGREVVGEVTAQEIDLRLPQAKPLRVALAAKARLRGDRLEILESRVSAPEIVARARGAIAFRPTAVDLDVHLETSGLAADRLGYLHGEIDGPATIDGKVEWSRDAWGFRGAFVSAGLNLFGFRVEALEGSVAVEKRAARVDVSRGRYEGGDVHGAFEVDLEPGRYPARLEVGVAEADLAGVLARFDLPGARLAGEVSGAFRYDLDLLGRGGRGGVGSGDFEVLPLPVEGTDRLPATGSVQVRIEGDTLALPSIELATPGVRAVMSGRLGLSTLAGEFDFEADAEDLGELLDLAEIGEPGEIWRPSEGTGIVSGKLTIAPQALLADLDLACAAVVAPGLSASRVSGTVIADARQIQTMDLTIEGPGASLALTGRLPFEGEGLDLLLRSERWPLAQAAPWLPFDLPADGPFSGTVRLVGSLERLAGEVDFEVAPAAIQGYRMDRLAGQARFDPERVELLRGALAAPAGRLEANGSLAIESGELDFGFGAPAIDLAAPPFAEPLGGRIGGRLAARGQLGGTLEAPRLSLDLSGVDVTVAGDPIPPDAPLELSAALEGGRLAVEGRLGDLLTLSGGGPLGTDGSAALEIDVATDRLGRWAALVSGAPVPGVDGGARGTLSISASPAEPLRATLGLPQLELRIDERTLHALEPVEVSWAGGDLEIGSLYLGDRRRGDELFVAGRVLLGATTGLDLRVQASVGAAVFRPFLGGYDVGGQLDLLAVVRGDLAQPEVNGQASLADGRWIPGVVPHSFEKVRGLALFYPSAVVLDRLEGDFAGGHVTAAGRVDRPAEEDLKYRFEISIDGVTLRYPAGWLLRGGGDFSLVSTPEGRLLRGETRLDRVFYLQDLALSPAQLLQRLLTRSRVEEVATDDLSATTALGIVVRAPGALRVRNNVARISGGGELTVRGSLARPVLFGEIVLDPGGTVEYGGNDYQLERARILFANPARIEPVLDVVARARISPYVVNVVLDGPISKLSTTFTSDPPLPDLDVLGLIATGSPLDPGAISGTGPAAAGGGTAADSSQAAETLLYGQAASLLSSRVNRLFGLDTLRIDPLTVGDAVSTARVTVGKRVSRQVFVTYSYDPSTTAQSILQVEWRLTDRLTLVLTQNGNESYAVDARWESRF